MQKRTTPRPEASDAATPTPTPTPARPAATRGRKTARRTGATTEHTATDEHPPTSFDTNGAAEPNEEDVRHHAYHLYLQRGGGHGSDFDDWVRAEQELKKKPKR